MAVYQVVLVRHGESTWNKENKFTGWFDCDLSPKGEQEAHEGGKVLREQGYKFDVAYTSLLKRAIKTLNIMQDELDLHWIPVHRHWRLNERHYGDLQGLNKAETAKLHGDAKVKKWRRDYAFPPPPLKMTDERWPGHDPKYQMLDKNIIPLSECLKDTVERVLPYWFDAIVPAIKSGQRVLIVAHGNSLRALVKYLDSVSDDAITEMNIPTGAPLVYELNGDLSVKKWYYLGDQEKINAAMAAVAAQGTAKKA